MLKSHILFTHHIFLTKEQRYGLLKPFNKIDLIGVCSYSTIENGNWKYDAINEIYCKYQIVYSNIPEENTMKIIDNNFVLTLTNEMPKHLLNIKDGGSECLMMTHRNVINKNNKNIPVIHFIEIEDIDLLINSLQ